jgi:hypothetical protein
LRGQTVALLMEVEGMMSSARMTTVLAGWVIL